MHLDGLDLSGKTGRTEAASNSGLDDTGLHASDGDSTDTTDLVHILQGQTEGLVDWAVPVDSLTQSRRMRAEWGLGGRL